MAHPAEVAFSWAIYRRCLPFIGLNLLATFVFLSITTMSIGDFKQGAPVLGIELLHSLPLTLLIFLHFAILTVNNFLDTKSRLVLKKKSLHSSIGRLGSSVIIGAGVGLCLHQIVVSKKSCTEQCLLLSRSSFLLPSILTLVSFTMSSSSRNSEFVPTSPAPPAIMRDILNRVVAASTFTLSRCLTISGTLVLLSFVSPLSRAQSLAQTAYIPFLVALIVSLLKTIFDSILATALTYPMDFAKLEIHAQNQLFNVDAGGLSGREEKYDVPTACLAHSLSLQPLVPISHINSDTSPITSILVGRNASVSDGMNAPRLGGTLRYRGPGAGVGNGQSMPDGRISGMYGSTQGMRGQLQPLWKHEMQVQLQVAEAMLKSTALSVVGGAAYEKHVSWWNILSYGVPTISSSLSITTCVDDTLSLNHVALESNAGFSGGTIVYRSSKTSITALALLGRSLALHDLCRIARASPVRRQAIYHSGPLLNTVMHDLCSVIDTTTLQVLNWSVACYMTIAFLISVVIFHLYYQLLPFSCLCYV
jgi:hypothetical protein